MLDRLLQGHPHLRHIAAHADVILGGAIMLLVVSKVAAPIGRFVLPRQFSLNAERDSHFVRKWSDHIASTVHAAIAATWALWNLVACPECFEHTHTDRLFGYSRQLARAVAFTVGYFVWDLSLIVSDLQYYGAAFLVHGLVGLSAFATSLGPMLLSYTPGFLLFELSTLFLNLHWILDKMQAPRWLQVANDVGLVGVFVGVRLVYGNLTSMDVLGELWWHHEAMPRFARRSVPLAILGINVLNNFWFVKIVLSLQKALTKRQAKVKEQ